jgi:lysophospholipase
MRQGQSDTNHVTFGNNMKNNFKFVEVEKGIFLRSGYWKSFGTHSKGTLCLLGGRTEFIEKYDETIERLNQLGLNVFSFDWRGQGLSTRLLENRRKGYVNNYDDYAGDLSFFVDNMFTKNTSRPYILMGHSMGGHIAVRFLHDHDDIFDNAILMSPMIDIRTFPVPKKVLQILTRIFVKAGYDQVYIAGNDRLMESKFRDNPLTSDIVRFEKSRKIAIDNPEIAVGGVTFGWLNASFDSIDLLNQPGYVENIRTRILLFSAEKDRVVCNKAQRRLCQRLPNCRLIKISDSRHEILQEKDTIQNQFWNIFKHILDTHF